MVKEKITFCILGLMWLVLTAHFCLAQDLEKVPIAVIEEPIYMLENVVEGTMVTHDFILKNKGTADLIIKGLKSG